jgi:N-acetyl-anhydromuramyl-L-alanine amidase AmpD
MKKNLTFLLLLVFFTKIAYSQTDTLNIIDKKVKFGMKSVAKRNIDAVVVHSTYYNMDGDCHNLENLLWKFQIFGLNAHHIVNRNGLISSAIDKKDISCNAGKCVCYDLDKILEQFRFYRVSAHYIIDRNGLIYNLVDEKNISFHAGKNIFPNNTSNGNTRSIGIELVCHYSDSVTEKQMKSLLLLVSNIQQRKKIKYVLRHSDIASDRKNDPWNFDWDDFQKQLKNKAKTKIIVVKK